MKPNPTASRRRLWMGLAISLVVLGVSLEAFYMSTHGFTSPSAKPSLPPPAESETLPSGASEGSEPLSPRLQVIKDTIQLLSPAEKLALSHIIKLNSSQNAATKSLPTSAGGSGASSTQIAAKPVVDSKKTEPKPDTPPAKPGKPAQPAAKTQMEVKPPDHVDGETLTQDLSGRVGSISLPHGLQGGSKIILTGTFASACFALELTDGTGAEIQLHVNFRPKRSTVVASTYIGDWGTEYVHQGMPLSGPFSVVVEVIAPKESRQPWTAKVSADGNTLFDSLLIPNFFRVSSAKVHQKCSKGEGNTYESLRVENAPKTALEAPSMAFDVPVTPESAGDNTIMLMGILSAPKNRNQRGAQRRAWLNHEFCTSGKGLVRFFIGMSGDAKLDKMVEDEAAKTHDIVILKDHTESYFKIAGKTAAMVHMAVGMGAKYLLKCDDDTYVDVPQILEGIKSGDKGLVLAAITYNGGAFRSGKWAMPVSDWPSSRYPPFPHGPGYVIGENILKYADEKLKDGTLRPLALEDVSMGVWIDHAKRNGVSVSYKSRKGKSRGSVNIGGCHNGAMISHYMLPEQMICMWDKQKSGATNLCC